MQSRQWSRNLNPKQECNLRNVLRLAPLVLSRIMARKGESTFRLARLWYGNAIIKVALVFIALIFKIGPPQKADTVDHLVQG